MSAYFERLMIGAKKRKWFDSSTAKDTANTFYAIRILTDTVFADLQDETTNIADTGGVLDSITVPAGIELLGQFNDVDLTSGVIECFSDSEIT